MQGMAVWGSRKDDTNDRHVDEAKTRVKDEELARLQRLVELYQSDRETTSDAGLKNEVIREEAVRKGRWF